VRCVTFTLMYRKQRKGEATDDINQIRKGGEGFNPVLHGARFGPPSQDASGGKEGGPAHGRKSCA